ncbi:oxygenase MpaB family protein [Marinoscillum sp.]|uniref:oxygenase MpaB family protein n=1 Tax=Marinoscillum sp. TaxID=2024838 RepID=UPI003BAD491E
MEYFVNHKSIVRKIWGSADVIMLIFAGASAEFALNKAVDWLYFTGRLPSDPLQRLFSTVSYAQAIVFSEKAAAHRAIDSMSAIHAEVESARGRKIPEWAYRDVLFMLIDYSMRAYAILERKLTYQEEKEVFAVFRAVGQRMGITDLPNTFNEWVVIRQTHLMQNLLYSDFTTDLFAQYEKHLGTVRYHILKQAHSLVAPQYVRKLLQIRKQSLLKPLIPIYKLSRNVGLDHLLKKILLPKAYQKQINSLETAAS